MIDVKTTQEWLCLHGFYTKVDGQMGPATKAAIKLFQGKNGLAQTGSVDQNTENALVLPLQRAKAALPPEMSEVKGEPADVLHIARQHLREHPREVGGQNRGPWVRHYMDGNEGDAWAWCAGFATTVLRQAGSPIGKFYSCDLLMKDAAARGKLSDKPMVGGLFLVMKSPTDAVHVGIVTSISPGVIQTIEGNTNDEGSREGYEVCARTRSFKGMRFIHL